MAEENLSEKKLKETSTMGVGLGLQVRFITKQQQYVTSCLLVKLSLCFFFFYGICIMSMRSNQMFHFCYVLRYCIPDFPYAISANVGGDELNSVINRVLTGKTEIGI